MRRKAFLGAIGLVALLFVWVTTAGAQLPKQGTYRGSFGAQGAGTMHELEEGHIFFVGGFNGVFMNDTTDGFIDRTQVICPG